MSPKQWLEELLSAGVSMLRGMTFPISPKSEDEHDPGAVVIGAALSGALYAAVMNGFADKRIPIIDGSYIAVGVVISLLFFFWISSKIFLKVTKSARELCLNLIECLMALWVIFLSITLVFGLMGEPIYADAFGRDAPTNYIFAGLITFFLAIASTIIYWLFRWVLRIVDAKYFDLEVVFPLSVKVALIVLQIILLTFVSYIFYVLPLMNVGIAK